LFGLSSQDPDYQAEVVNRLDLPFTMLSDERLKLAEALNLTTFSAPDHDRLYERLTLVLREGRSSMSSMRSFRRTRTPSRCPRLEENPVSRRHRPPPSRDLSAGNGAVAACT
jgi:peroxiredoxin